jgi:hypothetical protein
LTGEFRHHLEWFITPDANAENAGAIGQKSIAFMWSDVPEPKNPQPCEINYRGLLTAISFQKRTMILLSAFREEVTEGESKRSAVSFHN